MPNTENKFPPVIFAAFANPQGDLEHLNREQKGLQKTFFDVDKDGAFKYLSSIETSLDDYFDFLRPYAGRIAMFHFGGHAGSTGIALQSGHLAFDALANELALRNPQSLLFVFLNGCATEAHVQKLFEVGVPLVLATQAPVGDATATDFADRFYQNFIKGDSIKMAYESASNWAKALSNPSGLDFSRLGTVCRMSGAVQGAAPQSGAFPWALYVQDGKEEKGEVKLGDLLAPISQNAAPPATRIINTQNYVEKIDNIGTLNIGQMKKKKKSGK